MALLGALLASLLGCTADAPARLPTRAFTPLPWPTPTMTPFAIPARAYYEQGQAFQRAGDLEGALKAYGWAVERQPTLVAAYVARGSIYLAQGQFRQALADASAALERDPTCVPALLLRGEALREMGRPQAALLAFEQALALEPDRKAETFHSRWLAARDAHDGDALLALGREYAAHAPDDPLACYYQGWALLEAGRPVSASQVLVAGIAAQPEGDTALLWFALGHAYLASSAGREAVTAFEAARRLVEEGDSSLAWHSERPLVDLFAMLGRAYIAAGRCVDAETMLQYAVEIGEPGDDLRAFLEQARLCQTPTPPPTPYPTITPSFRP